MDTSYYNTGEAILVSEYLKALLSIQLLEPFEIGCITPYSAQSQEIQRLTGRHKNFRVLYKN
jgi:superfamily I DNA and/or RNA helicase